MDAPRTGGLVLAVGLLVAGCLGGGPGDLLGEDEVRTTWDLALEGCDGAAATVPVDTFRVEQEIPQGFEPVDSGGTFGLPGDSGRTNLTLLPVSCQDGEVAGGAVEIPSLAVALVRVHPEDLLEGDVDAAFYGFAVHGEDPTLRSTLQEMGHADNRSKVFANVTASPAGSGGEATVVGDETRYRTRVGAGNPADRYTSFRVYHAGDRGLLVLDARWEGADPLDGSAEIEANEGSRVGRLMDESREPAYGVVRPGASLAGTWHLVGGGGARSR